MVLNNSQSFKLSLFAIDLGLSGPDIGVVGLDQLGLLPELPPGECHDVKWDSDVGCDESLIVKVAVFFRVMDKHAKAASEGNQDAKEEGDAGADDPQRGLVWQSFLVHSLCTSGSDEENMGDQE